MDDGDGEQVVQGGGEAVVKLKGDRNVSDRAISFQLEHTITPLLCTRTQTHTQAPINWDEVEWSKFSPEEAHRLRHRMIEEKHQGHDLMHAEMILILFGAILAAQILLFVWRQKHRKSYQVNRACDECKLGQCTLPSGDTSVRV